MSNSNSRVVEYSRTGYYELTSQELHNTLVMRDLTWLPSVIQDDITCLGESSHLVHSRIYATGGKIYLELISFAELVPEEMVEASATSTMVYICPETFHCSERCYMYGGVLHCIPERDEDQGQGFWQKDVTGHILPVRNYMEMQQQDLDRWEEFLDMNADFPYSPIRELEEVATDICCRWAREVGEIIWEDD